MKKNSTLEYYEKNGEEYAARTKRADMSEACEIFLSYLDPEARILDLGCGSGRDSRYFLDQGYKVTSVDGSVKLCAIASRETGQKVILKTFDQIDYKEEFEGVWASASLLHAEKKEMGDLFRRICRALTEGGIFYVSFKRGTGEYEKDGRHFSDYTEDDLETLFPAGSGFTVLEHWISEDVRPDRAGEEWLNILAAKD